MCSITVRVLINCCSFTLRTSTLWKIFHSRNKSLFLSFLFLCCSKSMLFKNFNSSHSQNYTFLILRNHICNKHFELWSFYFKKLSNMWTFNQQSFECGFFFTVLMIVICLAEETGWTSVLYNFNLLLD